MEVKINIFYVDSDPAIAARSLVDRHCIKMILESAQLLSTAHRVLDGRETAGKSKSGRNAKRWVLDDARDNVIYTATHVNHPSAIWCRQSIENYTWLVDHMYALMDEYTHRYQKTHKCYGEIAYMLSSPPKNLESYDWTPMPSCMDAQYIISNDPIVNYRNYYKHGKSFLHAWKNRNPPEWIKT